MLVAEYVQGSLFETAAGVGLSVDPESVGLGEPFAVLEPAGTWVVARWLLVPKLSMAGLWVPHFWDGPGSRTWRSTDGTVPEQAARFEGVGAAAEALAGDGSVIQ